MDDGEGVFMSIKEKPLIDAVDGSGPLPGFLFANPIFLGFFTMVMCAVFGAVFAMFWTLHGTALETYEAVRWGAYVALIFGAIIMLGAMFSSGIGDMRYRLQFVVGGVLGIVFLFCADLFTVDYLREYLIDKGYLACTSKSTNCK